MNAFLKNNRTSVAALSVVMLVGTLAYTAQPSKAGAGSPSSVAATRLERPPIIPLPAPRHFVQTVDNPYSPFVPGTTWVYGGGTPQEQERIVVKVLERTRLIEGIAATVVRDTVKVNGELVEDTFDWYGQDDRGRVWYLGENT